ncbi:hypothetical protein CEUSTIGMA_g9357.t1 [Chlamydomonas eustigma]|uniref:Uncharacterized protein n=1 Tax=Chlamydomonas eustigma TaxID=1157962 RepID=A0A250XGA0_9CHLO|nr:hypothetical protein CEUSTIGMA_g9357.t1 [Chlamydomonas eustigma]|eukprot:GAX81929.1 hypothetical protein CEUSTIGMA_g9357.t1 [Chlamydomonas eustigma]
MSSVLNCLIAQSGYTPLLLAVDKEDIKLVRTLLTSVISNSEVRVAMLEKRFPLLELQMFEVNAVGLATVREDPDIVQALLEFGASPEDVEEVEALMGGDTPTSPTSPYSPGSCQAGSIMSLLSPGGNATNMVRPSFALAENLRNSLSLEPLLGGSHVDLLPENQEQAAEEEGAVPGDLLPENQEQADDDEGDVPGDLLPEHQEQAAEEEGAVPGDPSAEVELSILGDLEEEEQAEDEAENTDHQERVRESGQEQLLSGASDHNERVRESGQEQLLSGASDHHTGISADSVQAAGADIAAATSTNGTAQSPDTGADQTAATSTIDTTSLSSDATAATTEVGQVEEEAPTSTDNAELVGQLEEEAPLATDIAGFSQDKEEAPTTITDTSVFSQEEEEARPTATANETADAAVVNPEASEKVPTAAA